MPELNFRLVVSTDGVREQLRLVRADAEEVKAGIEKPADMYVLTTGADGKLRAVQKTAEDTQAAVEAPATMKISAETALGTIRDVKIAVDGVVQVVQGLARGMNSLLDSALGQKQAMTLATVAFGSAGAEMAGFATSMQQVTNFGDEQMLSLMAKLSQTFKLNKDDIQALVPVLLDFAEANKATGMTIESAFDLMGRALNGHTEMLGRYGIELDDSRLKTEGVAYLVEKLGADYGGTAQALADLRTQNANAWGDIQETIGAMLETIITPILRGLQGLMEAYQSLSPVMQGIVAGIGIAVPLVIGLAAAVTALRTAVVALRTAINPLTGILSAVAGGLTALAFGLAGAAQGTRQLNTSMQDIRTEAAAQVAQFETLVSTYTNLREKTSLTAEEQALLQRTISDLKREYPEHLRNLDLERGSHESITRAINATREALYAKMQAQVQDKVLAQYNDQIARMYGLIGQLRQGDPAGKNWVTGMFQDAEGYASGIARRVINTDQAVAELERRIAAFQKKALEAAAAIKMPPLPKGKDDGGGGTGSGEAMDRERADYERLLKDLAEMRLSELEKIEADYQAKLALVTKYTSEDSAEQRAQIADLSDWKTEEERKLNERLAAEMKAAADKKKTAEQEKFRTDIEYYSNLQELGVGSYDALKQTMEDYYAWAKENMTKEEQAMILLQLRQTNLRWGKVRQAEIDEAIRTQYEIAADRERFEDKWLELQNRGFELQLRAIDSFYAKQTEKLIQAGLSQEEIIKQQNEAKRRLYQAAAFDLVEGTSGMSGILANIAKTMDKDSKSGFKAYKALARAQAMMDALASANAAYKSVVGIPIVGPALAIVAAAAALAAGYVNVQAIDKIQYEKAEKGGYLQGPAHRDGGIVIEAEGDEYITAKERVKALGRRFFDFINFAPLDEVRAALKGMVMPGIPIPDAPVYAYAGGGSVQGNGLKELIAEMTQELKDAILGQKAVTLKIEVDPLENNPVKVSEINERGTQIRSGI